MAKDPVCGMDVDLSVHRKQSTEYHGQTYFFCAPGCRKAFEAEPDEYLQVLRCEGDPARRDGGVRFEGLPQAR